MVLRIQEIKAVQKNQRIASDHYETQSAKGTVEIQLVLVFQKEKTGPLSDAMNCDMIKAYQCQTVGAR